MRNKTLAELEAQYKRLLVKAFPKLRFVGIRWNWYKVYKDKDPFSDPTFHRIHTAFVSTAIKRGHPFYTNLKNHSKS